MWNETPGQAVTPTQTPDLLSSTDVRSDGNVDGKSGALLNGLSTTVVTHQSPLLASTAEADSSVSAGNKLLPVRDVLPISDPRLSVRERPFRALINLRGNPRDADFVRTAQPLLGCALPLRPNTTSVGPSYRVIWTGPDEWWVQSHDEQPSTMAAKLESDLRTAFGEQFATATDVGSGYTTLELRGPLARAVLARGCPLDLHARAFAPDHCAQSHFFKADIVLTRIEDDLFEMIIRRSFATYVAEILHDAAQPLLAG